MASNQQTIFLDYNSDFILTPNGSIQMATGWDLIRQRIIRRMLTNPAETLPSGRYTPADYIFHPAYGIGLASLVDQAESSQSYQALERRIAKAVIEDVAVDSSVPANIKFLQPSANALWILINVTLVGGRAGTIAIGATT